MCRILLVLLTMACLCLTGCAKNFMQPVSANFTVEQAAPDKAQIVFLRATTIGAPTSAPILEVTDSGLQFITIIRYGTKFLHKTIPGKHLYLIDGEFGYFMEADLLAGKTYYAYIIPRPGHWRARMQFSPVTTETRTSEQFMADIAWCDWHENAPESNQWFVDNKMRLIDRYSNLIQRYSSVKEATPKMRPEYGVDKPVR